MYIVFQIMHTFYKITLSILKFFKIYLCMIEREGGVGAEGEKILSRLFTEYRAWNWIS